MNKMLECAKIFVFALLMAGWVSHTLADDGDVATSPDALRIADGFKVELLYSVPADAQGSWVSLTVDQRGRLITSDQYGRLYRVTPSPLGTSSVDRIETIDVELGSAQGMLCAFDALYVVVNQSRDHKPGLYRVSDSDGDDQYDKVELLQKLSGRGEHGPHGIVLSSDGDSLFVVAGNATKLPQKISSYRLPHTWSEDLLLPRNPAPTGHATGRLAPGGWVCRVSPDGKDWELVAAGFRNPYDLAINSAGQLFTFDADMEHDIGAPWYRPTRVCHVVSGAEFGWRFGTGKWPSYNADSVPPVLDVGLGSPTGVTFGDGARFPARYKNALFVCDWTHGRLFAVHLRPFGSSYAAEFEEFVAGVPLPLTDIVVNPSDQSMYFTIGGRRTQSGLYRVTYVGDPTDGSQTPVAGHPNSLLDLRENLEALHAAPDSEQLDFVWRHLGHSDRYVRYAARIALEHLDPRLWQPKLANERSAETQISGLLAAARADQDLVVDEFVMLAMSLLEQPLTSRQHVDLLRALAITFSRHGVPPSTSREMLADKLEGSYPAESKPLVYELCKMLVYLESDSVLEKTLPLMRAAGTQEELLNYAMSLRVANRGWNDASITEYFTLLNEAERKATTGEFVGSGHLQTYLKRIRRDAAERLADEQRTQFAKLVNPTFVDASEIGSPTPRKFVRRWTIDDLLPKLSEIDQGRSFNNGNKLFTAASCIMCHRFNNRGGIFGPDLTAVAKRYGRKVLLREIIEPSKQVSDQYQTHNILTDAGVVYSGRIITRGEKVWTVAVDPKSPASVIEIPADEVEQATPSTVSMMPQNLLDTLSLDDILDLFAYLESGGDADYHAFGRE